MTPRLLPVGDACLSLVFEETIDPDVNARCVAIADALERRARRGIRDIVPAYNTVTVHFDPNQFGHDELGTELSVLAEMDLPEAGEDRPLVTIPVRYGGEFGPDLAAVAEFGRCSEQDVIALHAGSVYRVYMLGFLPGFPYMGSVDSRIAMPRLETPRMRVAAGSVGIAGAQTGVYPCDTPGGWRIIGRTDTKIFDPARGSSFLVRAGDLVKFVIA